MFKFEDVFEVIEFPSKETHVRCKNVFPRSGDTILKRCNTWQDVMHLVTANSILKRNSCDVVWFIPYKPFARQDRVTGAGHACESAILQEILKDINVIYLDVHSAVFFQGNRIAPQQGKFYSEIRQRDFVEFVEKRALAEKARYIQVVPDKGALVKVDKNRYHIVCEKTRDPLTGILSDFRMLEISEHITRNLESTGYLPAIDRLILIDDICDGGGTFFALADVLKPLKEKYNLKLDLLVTHGIFSKGIDRLLGSFDNIYTTNSFDRDIKEKYPDKRFVVYDVEEILNECMEK